MARENSSTDLVLSKRWPRKFLQFFPAAWKKQYLLRKSGGETSNGTGESFDLVRPFKEAKRLLIVWPETKEEALLAFPALRALQAVTGPDAVYAHLSTEALLPILSDLFPGHQALAWSREELAWHEPSIQTVSESLAVFSPQISINLMQPCPPILQALVRASGAKLRMALDEGTPWPYSNLRLQSGPENLRAAHYFQILDLWKYAGFFPEEKWIKLAPDEGQQLDAERAWAEAQAKPEENWVYLHDAANPARPLDDDLYSWLWERIHLRDSEEVGIVLAVVEPTGKLLIQDGMWKNVPVLKAADFSELLCLVNPARGVAGFQGWGIHCAGLADVQCLALLQSGESVYDISRWNPLFEMELV